MFQYQIFQINQRFCNELWSGCLPWKEPAVHSIPGSVQSQLLEKGKDTCADTALLIFPCSQGISSSWVGAMAQGIPGSKQTGALCLCMHSDYSNCLSSPREFRASWKTRNMKGGAEAQLSIHTLPAASPARRGGDKHSHEGILPAQPLAPGTLGSHQHTNSPERLVKDRAGRQLYPVLSHSRGCWKHTALALCFGLLCGCTAAAAAHPPLPGPTAFLGSQTCPGLSRPAQPTRLRTVPRREGQLPFSRHNPYLTSSCLRPPGNGPGMLKG